MSVLNISTVQDFSFTEDRENGVVATFSGLYKVAEGATPEQALNAAHTEYNALLGKRVSNIADGTMSLQSFTLAPAGGETQYLSASFSLGPIKTKRADDPDEPVPWVYTFSTSTMTIQTTRAKGDILITVGSLEDSDDKTEDAGAITAIPKTVCTVEKVVPVTRISANGQSTSNPFSSVRGIVGKLNNDAVTIDGVSFDVGTLMLVGVNVSTPNDGKYYNVSYELEYREDPKDWCAVVAGVDPLTGKPYRGIGAIKYLLASGDVLVGGAEETIPDACLGYEIYDSGSFSPLNLS